MKALCAVLVTCTPITEEALLVYCVLMLLSAVALTCSRVIITGRAP